MSIVITSRAINSLHLFVLPLLAVQVLVQEFVEGSHAFRFRRVLVKLKAHGACQLYVLG